MKTVKTVILSLFTITLFSQNTIEKTVGEFSTLKAFDLINVELVKSNQNKVEIKGKNASDVVIVNKNGVLKIKMNLEEIFDGNKTDVILYYTDFEVLDANEGAYITSKQKLKKEDLTLKAQEGGFINLELKVQDLEIDADTGGVLDLTGKVNNQDIKITTGAIFKGSSLKSVTTRVNIKAGGDAYINASELVDVKIRVGGDVYIYGDPKTVNESRVIGGRIKRME